MVFDPNVHYSEERLQFRRQGESSLNADCFRPLGLFLRFMDWKLNLSVSLFRCNVLVALSHMENDGKGPWWALK